jgi:hypothetical protein
MADETMKSSRVEVFMHQKKKKKEQTHQKKGE